MGGNDSQKLLPWRGSTPLRGANLRLNYEINNVTETAVGISRAHHPWPVWPWPQLLQPAWVIFAKHRWVSSGARRSYGSGQHELGEAVLREPAIRKLGFRRWVGDKDIR